MLSITQLLGNIYVYLRIYSFSLNTSCKDPKNYHKIIG